MNHRDRHVAAPRDVLDYWIGEVGPEGWYVADADVDAEIRTRFAATRERAASGGLVGWQGTAEGMLAYLIVVDQFPRNLFRGDARSFALDQTALAAAKRAIVHGWDMRVAEPERQFFYLPLMHSETLPDQARGVRLIQAGLPETGAPNLLHARAHREVIRLFGRFPHRNEVLGRSTTGAEREFLDAGGYGALVRRMSAAQ